MRTGWPTARRTALHVALPLLAGGLMYVAARSRALFFWDWADRLGIEPLLLAVRSSLGFLAATPDFVRFTLPDALWVYSLSAALCLLHGTRRGASGYVLVPLALGPGAELLQLVHVLPGTFDPLDLLATVIASAIPFAVLPRRAAQGRGFGHIPAVH